MMTSSDGWRHCNPYDGPSQQKLIDQMAYTYSSVHLLHLRKCHSSSFRLSITSSQIHSSYNCTLKLPVTSWTPDCPCSTQNTPPLRPPQVCYMIRLPNASLKRSHDALQPIKWYGTLYHQYTCTRFDPKLRVEAEAASIVSNCMQSTGVYIRHVYISTWSVSPVRHIMFCNGRPRHVSRHDGRRPLTTWSFTAKRI